MKGERFLIYGRLLAGPIALVAATVAATCSTDEKPKTPVIPNYVEDQIENPPTLQPTPKTTVPTATEEGGREVNLSGSDESLNLYDGITAENLLATATMLDTRMPGQINETLGLLKAAQLEEETNPLNPDNGQRVKQVTDILISKEDELCTATNPGIRDLARGFAKELTSYLNQNAQEQFEIIKPDMIASKCYWEEQLVENPQPTEQFDEGQSPAFVAVISPNANNIRIVEPSRKYDLFATASVDTLEMANFVIGQYMPDEVNQIKAELDRARAKELANPQDPQLADIATNLGRTVATGLSAICHDPRAQITLKYYASFAYHKDPDNWQNRSETFTGNSCYWGKVGNYQDQFEGLANGKYFVTDDGLMLYTDISWDKMRDPDMFDSLRQEIESPEVTAKAQEIGVITDGAVDKLENYLAKAESAYSQDPQSYAAADNLTFAGHILETFCRVSPMATEGLRRLASFSRSNLDTHWISFKDFTVTPCREFLDQ